MRGLLRARARRRPGGGGRGRGQGRGGRRARARAAVRECACAAAPPPRPPARAGDTKGCGALRTVAAGTPRPRRGPCRPVRPAVPAGGAPAGGAPQGGRARRWPRVLWGWAFRGFAPPCTAAPLWKRLTGRGGGGDTRPGPVSARATGRLWPRPSHPVPSLLCQVWGAGTLRARAAPRACGRGRPAVGLCWPPRAAAVGPGRVHLSLPPSRPSSPGWAPLAVGALPGPGLRGLWTQERPWVRAGLPLAGACLPRRVPPPPPALGLPGGRPVAGSLLSGDALLCGWLGQARCWGVRWDWFSSESAPRSDTTPPVCLDDWTVGSHMRGPEWGLQVLPRGGTFSLSRIPPPKSQMYVRRGRQILRRKLVCSSVDGRVPCGLASPVHSCTGRHP